MAGRSLPASSAKRLLRINNRLEVRYSECRLFRGSITIAPDVTRVPER